MSITTGNMQELIA
jgi:hypothetical protein